jgi:uncharacterized membrane protein
MTVILLLIIVMGVLFFIGMKKLDNRIDSLSKRLSQIEKKDLPSQALTQSLHEQTVVESITFNPKPPSPPNPIIVKLKDFLLGGNVIAKIGIVILFFGVAFLLRFAAAHVDLPIFARLLGVFFTGIVMVALGCKLVSHNKNYATILQGGGVGLMYLSIYAAFMFYHLLNPLPVFLLLLSVVIVSGWLACFYDAKLLALFSMLGGFLAPLLISTETQNYSLLFSYYLLLNMAIAVSCWFKSWPELNLIGFVFTFIISALWGHYTYQAGYFSQAELFLIIFFLFYVLLCVLLTLKQVHVQKKWTYNVLLLATPVVVFSLQIGLVKAIPYGLAWSAFALFIFYALLAGMIYLFKSTQLRHLISIFTALSLLFATITLPLVLANIDVASAWALESILVLYFGMRESNSAARLGAGLILLACNILSLWNALYEPNTTFISEYYLSSLLVVIANFICSYLFFSLPSKKYGEHEFAKLFFVLASIAWYYLNLSQLWLYVNYDNLFFTTLLFIANSSLLAWLLGEYLAWVWLRNLSLLLLPAMMVLSVLSHPNFLQMHGGTLTWLYSFVVFYFILYRHEQFPGSFLATLHLIASLYLIWFVADQVDLLLRQYQRLSITWQYMAWGMIPALAIYLSCYKKFFLSWPLKEYQKTYQYKMSFTLVIFLLFWFLKTNTLPGNFNIVSYIPLINPLDITITLVFISFVVWYQIAKPWLDKNLEAQSFSFALALLSLLIFIWLNVMVFRTIHQWLHIPYNPISLLRSVAAQMCLSILWAVLALIATYVASKRQLRELWFIGLVLILIVITKLFLIDMSGSNTLERIITFIGVGILFLINGYISPLPPKSK